MNKIYVSLLVMTIAFTFSSCALKDFAMQDDWNDGKNPVTYVDLTISTEMIPEFTFDKNASFFILEPKAASIKEQKILYTLKKLFANNKVALKENIKESKYVITYSETLQKSKRLFSVPTFYSTYTNYTGFSGQSVNAISYSTGSRIQMTTNYFNVINLSLFEWKNNKLNIVWNGNAVVDADDFKINYKIYTELLVKLLGKETTKNTVKIEIVNNEWKIKSY